MKNEITAHDWEIINGIIAYIYSATPYPNLGLVVDKLRKLLKFKKSLACLVSDQNGKVEFFHYQSDDISQEHIDLYCSRYAYFDFITWYAASPKPLVCRESDIIVEQFMADSIFMKEWLEPIGVYHGILVNIAGCEHCFGNISLYKSKEEGDFSDKDIMILKTVNEHLCIRFSNLFPKGISHIDPSTSVSEYITAYHLTEREAEVIRAVCEGALRQHLCAMLYISENTVKKHLNSIYKKMDVHSFEELVRKISPGVRYF